ncbi:hypothetical protein FY134_04595 [Agrobacterium fabrum]|uniref:hypothetical protein n=1 Tax=Agrobacterium fabrum TaxID=1176649 RepID=UPI0021CDFD64|nr:hypothetical protein [Agrobacterium fabrum]UXT56967.1 hypothetical protein FY134_04595 [Agrobacterium fabrum]
MKMPKTADEWIALLKTVLWSFGKLRLLSIIIGAVLTIAFQLLTGFWTFRENHQQLILKQYEAAVVANAKFDQQLAKYNLIFDGKPLGSSDYSNDAQNYIGSLKAVSQLLPATNENLNTYIKTLARLNRYYSTQNVPARGTEEWMKFYGNFRIDFDQYTTAKEVYMEQLSSELGGYVRYLRNS